MQKMSNCCHPLAGLNSSRILHTSSLDNRYMTKEVLITHEKQVLLFQYYLQQCKLLLVWTKFRPDSYETVEANEELRIWSLAIAM